jgi:branched-chain amino acid transport system substrate-binding protein
LGRGLGTPWLYGRREKRFQDGTEDFTEQISAFKAAGCEIGYGIFIPPTWSISKQSIQQGWIPKLPTYAKAMLFPQTVEVVGPIANNLCAEVWWTPAYPYTSSLLGQNCQEFAADFEAKKNMQWTQPLMHFLIFEWAIDALTRTKNVDDKNAIVDAVKTTKLETIAGMIDFTAPVEPAGPPFTVGPCHIHENVYKSPMAAGQWRTSTKYPFDLTIVGNKACPDVAVEDKVRVYTGA